MNKKPFNSVHPTKRSYKTNFVIPISQHRFTKGTSYALKRSYKTNFVNCHSYIPKWIYKRCFLCSKKEFQKCFKLTLSFLSLKKDLQNMSVKTLRLVLTQFSQSVDSSPDAATTTLRLFWQPRPWFPLSPRDLCLGLAIWLNESGSGQSDKPDYINRYNTNPTQLLIESKPVTRTRPVYYSGYLAQTQRTRLVAHPFFPCFLYSLALYWLPPSEPISTSATTNHASTTAHGHKTWWPETEPPDSTYTPLFF